MGYIYRRTNTVNGKAYIGQTTRNDWRVRIDEQSSKPGCRALYNAIQKHGEDAFTTDLLAAVPDHVLDDVEIHCIKQFDTLSPNGYNLTAGGGGCKSPSPETRKKISEAHKGVKHHNFGKPRSPETREKISKSLSGENHPFFGLTGERHPSFGKKHSQETRDRMSESRRGDKNPNFGKTHSQETRNRISEKKRGKRLSPEHRLKISKAQRGIPKSPEGRENIRRANQKRQRFKRYGNDDGQLKLFE